MTCSGLSRGAGIGDEPGNSEYVSTQPTLEEAVPGGEGEDADSLTVKSIRKTGAVTPHARSEEREQETEPCQAGLRRHSASGARSHRKTIATAPVLDSTHKRRLQLKPCSHGHARSATPKTLALKRSDLASIICRRLHASGVRIHLGASLA